MKRFVDVRRAETGWRFAWYCTVKDCFEVHGGQQAWDTFDEFAEMYKGDELERYRGLCPKWVFTMKLVCVNGHDRCYEGPTENCPYCERR